MQHRWRILTLLVALGLILAACGTGSPSPSAAESQPAESQPAESQTPTGPVTIIHGTTDQPVHYDPAGSYDLPSWNVIYNVMGTLLTMEPGAETPTPDLAESCEFEDPQTYTCVLRSGVTFHDGSAFDAEDVKFSFDRNAAIAAPEGASSLNANLEEVEVVDASTVTFHLAAPDATWPFVLTTGGNGIVPSDSYPADELQDDTIMVGTGPYMMTNFQAGVQTTLEVNPNYYGDAPANDTVIIQYFENSATLKLALENGEVDLAYRSLTPTELDDLRTAEGIQVIDGQGAEIRYLNFNLSLEPGDELAVRKAVAYLVDRQAIADNVWNGTVEPLWSMNPAGFTGHEDSFMDLYGGAPDPAAAEQVLSDAGVSTPVDIEIWWTPTHYGDSSADEYTEIKRQLEDSGLFSVTLMSTEWQEYTGAAFTDQYPAFQLGWFPDFPDPDNYLGSFYASTSFLNIHYAEVDDLIAAERAETDPTARAEIFREIQEIVADDAPIIPIWQGKQVAAALDGVTGIDQTFDPSFIFRYWLISKQ